jgi:hypothetical protein
MKCKDRKKRNIKMDGVEKKRRKKHRNRRKRHKGAQR